MKRIFSVMILTAMTVSFLLPIFTIKSCAMEQKEPVVENTTKEVGEEKQSPSSNSKVVLTLSELMEKLLNDNSWLLGLSERLAKNKIILNGEELKDKVREFFSEQEHKGCKGKEEADCREYVFNWIKYKYKNYYGNESKCNGQISTIKIEANRPEDYTGYC